MSQPPSLNDRYGRSRSTIRRNAIAMWMFIAFVIVALIAWLLWANPLKIGPSAEARDIGHTVVDSGTVVVDFSVTVTPGHEFACAIEALNTGFAIVGWKVFVYPASDVLTQTIQETVKTTEQATTGFVSSCWLT